jgi:hypothetical protein
MCDNEELILNADNATKVKIFVQKDAIETIRFTKISTDTFSATAKIVVSDGSNYESNKEYTVGAGLSIIGDTMLWVIDVLNDLQNINCDYDARIVSGGNKRDMTGQLIVNQSLL